MYKYIFNPIMFSNLYPLIRTLDIYFSYNFKDYFIIHPNNKRLKLEQRAKEKQEI